MSIPLVNCYRNFVQKWERRKKKSKIISATQKPFSAGNFQICRRGAKTKSKKSCVCVSRSVFFFLQRLLHNSCIKTVVMFHRAAPQKAAGLKRHEAIWIIGATFRRARPEKSARLLQEGQLESRICGVAVGEIGHSGRSVVDIS